MRGSVLRWAGMEIQGVHVVFGVGQPFMKETAEKMGMPGGLPAAENAKTYVAVVEGRQTGEVIFTGP